MKKTALLFGGNSDERMVSVSTAQNLARHFRWDRLIFVSAKDEFFDVSSEELSGHLNPVKVEFFPSSKPVSNGFATGVDLMKDFILFLGFHGGSGENGVYQKIFEAKKILFTGSGFKSSQACFDKVKSKVEAERAGVRIAKGWIIEAKKGNAAAVTVLAAALDETPLVLKPILNGSSVGLFFLKNAADLKIWADALALEKFGDYLAEEWLQGPEITVGVIESAAMLGKRFNRALPPTEVELEKGRTFDYDGKYLGLGTKEITPARITDEQTRQCQKLAIDAHVALGCYGYSRTDMILTSAGPVFLETNTLPGLTKASFVPQQLAAEGTSLLEFLQGQLELAGKRSL